MTKYLLIICVVLIIALLAGCGGGGGGSAPVNEFAGQYVGTYTYADGQEEIESGEVVVGVGDSGSIYVSCGSTQTMMSSMFDGAIGSGNTVSGSYERDESWTATAGTIAWNATHTGVVVTLQTVTGKTLTATAVRP